MTKHKSVQKIRKGQVFCFDLQIRIGQSRQCSEVRFASFLSGGFTTTMAVMNQPEKKSPLCMQWSNRSDLTLAKTPWETKVTQPMVYCYHRHANRDFSEQW